MKKRVIFAVVCTVWICTLYSGECAETAPFIEQKPNGSINWTQGIVQAVGIGKPDETGSAKPLDAGVKALYHARTNAKLNLIQILKGIRIDSKRNVAAVAGQNYSILAKINEIAFETPEIEKLRKHLPDGTVEVRVQLALYGGFSQLVLPPEIQQIESIKPVRSKNKQNIQQAGKLSAPEIFTGLVIDARGTGVEPSLVPSLLDENGNEVFGAAFASREFAVQWGMCGYSSDIKASINSERVGYNPLVVKGLRPAEPGSSDIIISNTDAAKLLSSSEHLLFLKKCRVLIVLDSPVK